MICLPASASGLAGLNYAVKFSRLQLVSSNPLLSTRCRPLPPASYTKITHKNGRISSRYLRLPLAVFGGVFLLFARVRNSFLWSFGGLFFLSPSPLSSLSFSPPRSVCVYVFDVFRGLPSFVQGRCCVCVYKIDGFPGQKFYILILFYREYRLPPLPMSVDGA